MTKEEAIRTLEELGSAQCSCAKKLEDKFSGTFDLISAPQKPSPHAQQDVLVCIKYPCHHDERQGYEEERHKISLIPFVGLFPVSSSAQDKLLAADIA